VDAAAVAPGLRAPLVTRASEKLPALVTRFSVIDIPAGGREWKKPGSSEYVPDVKPIDAKDSRFADVIGH
jgi:hypothetical protein